MRMGLLIYEEMRKYFTIYEESVSRIWPLQLLYSKFSYIWGKINFLFYQCRKVESGEDVHAAKMKGQIFKFSVATNTFWLADLYKLGSYFRNRQLTTFLCHSDSSFCYVYTLRYRIRRSVCGTGSSGAMMAIAIVSSDNFTCNSKSSFFCVFYSQMPDEEECLRDRKRWCFLLSSMLTFAIGFTDPLIVILTHPSSVFSIPRYRMWRSACGTGNSGASCSPPCSPLLSISLTTLLVILTHPSSMISISRYRMRRSVWGTGNGGAMMTYAIGFTDNLSCNSHSQFFYDFYAQIPDEEECLGDRKWWCHDDLCHRFHWQPFL